MHVQRVKPTVNESHRFGQGKNSNLFFICNNCAMLRTPENDCLRTVDLLHGGCILSATARHFVVQRSTVRMWYKQFQDIGSVTDLPRRGHSQVTSSWQDHYIIVLRNRLLPATVTAGNIPALRRISSDTIR